MKKGCGWIILVLLISVLFIWNKCAYRHFESLEFKGTIDSIWYDDKNDPAVTIKTKTYRLTFGKDELEINDSLVKFRGSFTVRQFRNGHYIRSFVWGENERK